MRSESAVTGNTNGRVFKVKKRGALMWLVMYGFIIIQTGVKTITSNFY